MSAAHGVYEHSTTGSRRMALGATLHCLTGCAVGEIAGLLIGTSAGLSTPTTLALSVALAFFFGYLLSTLPLLQAGVGAKQAFTVVLAADTLSIATMELADNATMTLIPGAMGAGLDNPRFWWAMTIALVIAFTVAYPVNTALFRRGRGHALTHGLHHHGATEGPRSRVPVPTPGALAMAIGAFLAGGLLASAGTGTDPVEPDTPPHLVR